MYQKLTVEQKIKVDAIFEDIEKRFTEPKTFLVTLDPIKHDDESSWTGGRGMGNGLMHTGFVHILKDFFYGGTTQQARFRWDQTMASVTADNPDGSAAMGVYHRAYFKIGDNQKQDDYILIAGASKVLQSPHANDIVLHGKKSGWFFWNKHPTMRAEAGALAYPDGMFDRFPGLTAFMRMCVVQPMQEAVSVWEKLLLAGQMVSGAFKSNPRSDGCIQTTAKFLVLRPDHPLIFYPAWWLWAWRIRKKFGSIPKSWEGYLQPGHPLLDLPDVF